MAEASTAAGRSARRPRIALTLLAAGLAAAVAAGPALAFVAEPSDAQAQAAVEAGKKLAADVTRGFTVKDYLLFGREDPLSIGPSVGEIDAVVVMTPIEMLRYESYLQSFQGAPLTPDQVKKRAGELRDTVHFTVFAHAPSGKPEDQDFLERFSDFRLLTADGRALEPTGIETFGPAQDFFTVTGARTSSEQRSFRWLGTNTVAFSLAPLRQQGAEIGTLKASLSFKDSTGAAHSYKVDMSKYR